MAQYFFDTSAAVKYYHDEIGTAEVSNIFAERDRSIALSTLGLLELQSAFALKVRTGVLDRESAGLQRSRLLLDIAAGDIQIFDVTNWHYTSAGRLIGRYGFRERLRALDAIQLAVALDLAEQTLLDVFVVSDIVLARVAALEGLRVTIPGA